MSQSPLICTKCDVRIGACTCPDRDALLKRVVFDPASRIVAKWCRACDKHYARCRCATPDFYCVVRGVETDLSGGVQSLTGVIVPDLKAR